MSVSELGPSSVGVEGARVEEPQIGVLLLLNKEDISKMKVMLTEDWV